MSADRWQTLDRIFVEAMQVPAEARPGLVSRACGDDGELQRDVLSLVSAAESSGEFLEASALERLATAMAADGWSLEPGQRLGAYVVRELLGAGAVGEVWRASDERLDRDVAIKVLLPHLSGDPERVRYFTEEARTAGSLNHPNILSVHDVGEHGGAPFIVSEYVEGESLRARLKRGPLPVDTALAVTTQIARGLAAAHQRGIIHRDLKPDNIFLRSDGGVKILDFGLATLKAAPSAPSLERHAPPDAAVTGLAGTAGYAAPEQIRGIAADVRSDLFALGVTMYEMLAGERPFGGSSAIDALRATVSVDPADPGRLRDGVPPSLARIVMRLLAKSPEMRFQSADELLRALAGERSAPGSPSPRWSAATTVILAAALLTAAIGAVFIRSPPPSQDPVAPGSSGRPAVAVLNFADMTGAGEGSWLATGIPSMLVTGLAQTPGLHVVSPQRVQEALVRAGHTDSASLKQSEAADVARLAGAGALVAGTIYKSGEEIRIDAQVQDLATGRVLWANTVTGTDVFSLADSLAARIRTGIGFGESVDLRRITDVSSTSIAAYRLYARSLDASVSQRWAEAARLLEAAVGIDPTFAEAHLRLATAYTGLGRIADRDQALRHALAHAHKLSARHRLLLSVQVEPDAARKARLLDELLTRFPDVEEAYWLAQGLYDPAAGSLPDAGKLVAITGAGVRALPASGQVRNAYGYALLATGRYAEAAREFEEYARLAPLEADPLDSLGEAYLLLGEPARAVDAYSRALALDRAYPSNNGLAYALGMLARYEEATAAEPSMAQIKVLILSRAGRYAEAERVIRDGVATAHGNEHMLIASGLRLISAALALERRDFARVVREVNAARLSLSGVPRPYARNMTFIADTLAGLADLGMGRTQRVRELADSQVRTHLASNPVDRLWHGILMTELALAKRDPDAAETAFSAAELPRRGVSLGVPGSVLTNNLILRDGPARAAIARGDRAGAIRLYRRLLANGPELRWVSLYEPRYVLQIARLLDASGDRRGARVEYERFLELWRNADAGLPEVSEARRAVERE